MQRRWCGPVPSDSRWLVTIYSEIAVTEGLAPAEHITHVFDVHFHSHASVAATGRKWVIIGLN